jgi:hypothetical protein
VEPARYDVVVASAFPFPPFHCSFFFPRPGQIDDDGFSCTLALRLILVFDIRNHSLFNLMIWLRHATPLKMLYRSQNLQVLGCCIVGQYNTGPAHFPLDWPMT